jgi:hypothetical protein
MLVSKREQGQAPLQRLQLLTLERDYQGDQSENYLQART